MERTNAYQVNWALRAAAVLLCLVLISVWMLSGLLAKYTVSGTGADDARVASFKVTADLTAFEETFTFQLAPDSAPKVFQFEVTNSSETAVEVQAVLDTEGNLPLMLEYKEGEAPETDWTRLTENIQTMSDDKNTWRDELSAGNNSKKTYQIRVSWSKEDGADHYQYANGVASVRLAVTASQID